MFFYCLDFFFIYVFPYFIFFHCACVMWLEKLCHRWLEVLFFFKFRCGVAYLAAVKLTVHASNFTAELWLSEVASYFVVVVWLTHILAELIKMLLSSLSVAPTPDFDRVLCWKTMWTEGLYVTCIPGLVPSHAMSWSKDEDARAIHEDLGRSYHRYHAPHELYMYNFCKRITGGAINTTKAYTWCWFYCVDTVHMQCCLGCFKGQQGLHVADCSSWSVIIVNVWHPLCGTSKFSSMPWLHYAPRPFCKPRADEI